MFRTQFDRVRVFANVGNRFKDTYHAVVQDNGSVDLEKDGVEDVYAFIQSHKDSVDINLLLQRYARGDVSSLNKVAGAYGDFTNFPKTYAEALQAVISAEAMFNDLPLETRAKFGHDVNRFISGIGTDDWNVALGLSPVDKPVEIPVDKSVVKEGVSVE